MQKKSIFTILGVMLAVVVTSLTLVFAVGPIVSADDENGEPKIGLLDKLEYFDIDDDGHLSTLSDIGMEYAGKFDFLKVNIPNTVTEISGNIFYYGGFSFYSIFSANIGVAGFPVDYSDKVVEVVLPDTLESITSCSFIGCNALKCIRIPASVKDINKTKIYQNPNSYSLFDGCDNLTTIYCECSQEFAEEHWIETWNASSYYDEENGEWVDRKIPVKYNCNKTVTFNTNGGNEPVAVQTVCVDHYVSKPADPTRENYVFQYWYTTDENTPFDFANEQVTDNMTLTAKWEPVATQNNENQNQENNQNNETTNNEVASAEKKNNPLMAWIGGGIAAGLSVICGAAIVVAKKRRK